MASGLKYKYIFFDLDRTLWDFETNSSLVLREIYTMYGLDKHFSSFARFVERYNYHNDKLWNDYRKGLTTKDILRNLRFELTLEDAGIKDPQLCSVIGDFYLDQSPKKNMLFPGSIEILEYLKSRGYHLYILTNGFRKTQVDKMANSGITAYFERLYTSEEIGYNKPGREIFHWAVTSLNARKSECIMIGDDNEVDIEGAAAYGIDSIWFNPENSREPTRANHIVSSLDQIREVL